MSASEVRRWRLGAPEGRAARRDAKPRGRAFARARTRRRKCAPGHIISPHPAAHASPMPSQTALHREGARGSPHAASDPPQRRLPVVAFRYIARVPQKGRAGARRASQTPSARGDSLFWPRWRPSARGAPAWRHPARRVARLSAPSNSNSNSKLKQASCRAPSPPPRGGAPAADSPPLLSNPDHLPRVGGLGGSAGPRGACGRRGGAGAAK